MRGDAAVEARGRRLEVARRAVLEAAHRELLADGLLEDAGDAVRRLHADVEDAAEGTALEAGQLEADQRADCLLGRLAWLGGDVEQDLAEAGAGDAVDDRVVHLGQRRDAAALDALDEPELPERSGAVELVGHQPADQLVELLAATRRGHTDPAQVEVDVELVVLDEPGPVQAERTADDPPPQLRHLRQPLDDQLAHPVEAEVRGLGGVADSNGSDVHVPARRLGVPERRVDARQPLHATRLPENRPEIERVLIL